MRYLSHFSAIFLATALAAACTKSNDKTHKISDERLMLVSAEAYRSAACWTHKDGSFRAFLLLGKEGSYAVPEFISVNCLAVGDYTSDGGAVISNIGVIRMLDSYRQLQNRFPDLKIGGNVATDQPFPSGKSELYYFKADLDRITHPHLPVYAPSKIKTMAKLGISFNKFLELSREERETLLQSLK